MTDEELVHAIIDVTGNWPGEMRDRQWFSANEVLAVARSIHEKAKRDRPKPDEERLCPHGHRLRRKCQTCDNEDDLDAIRRAYKILETRL